MRKDGRLFDQLRPLKVTTPYLKFPEGSALIEMGDTKVICTATIEEKVPPFLKGENKGWITAEYAMLPRATESRTQRDSVKGKISGRSSEIQRLIGRSLRSVVDLSALGERTIWIDCDVIQADGGTRTAAINGSFIALYQALTLLVKEEKIPEIPVNDFLAAVSVGIVDSGYMLDLTFEEDSCAEVDMNVVMTGNGHFVEVQGTAEKVPYSREALARLLELAEKGIGEIIEYQKSVLLRGLL